MKKEDTVKLISSEGMEFVIDKEAAMVSQTIRNMLTSPGGFAEAEHGVVTFPEINAVILEKICQYFYWSLQYSRGKETDDSLSFVIRGFSFVAESTPDWCSCLRGSVYVVLHCMVAYLQISCVIVLT
ncbi:hypothetical protein V6N11_031094 [Hibiscus sabdariffa]|uniref:Elongin-C n=1 Tax=Hibiscus sabdariffa TaxID=183260 RepID=A0ABR1ZWP4_9ROSI